MLQLLLDSLWILWGLGFRVGYYAGNTPQENKVNLMTVK